MAVRPQKAYALVPRLEGDQDMTVGREDPPQLGWARRNSAKHAAGSASGMCAVEYRDRTPPSEAPGRSSAVITDGTGPFRRLRRPHELGEHRPDERLPHTAHMSDDQRIRGG
ncbi:hypothetical protein ACGFZH_23435 [Streptomyces zaomyceticus]|uniref:hypothetical protein n=1 Tax=Streptomyces zaomyceticus TaxID=68286 RepID=UPI003718642C